MRICVVGASGKLGQYMVRQLLEAGDEVAAVCRPESVKKLDEFAGRIEIFPGKTNDRAVLRRALQGCDGAVVVLVPWGVQQYASGTAQAVLDYAEPAARLVFSCGWHITMDGRDRYPWHFTLLLKLVGAIAKMLRLVELGDQVEACRRVFASDRRWTVVRGSDLEEGPSEGLPVWSEHVGDPILASNKTRRVDFAGFMVAALRDDSLLHKAPAIVSCRAQSVIAQRGE